MSVTFIDAVKKARAEMQAAFKVLAMVDLGKGRQRIAVLSPVRSFGKHDGEENIQAENADVNKSPDWQLPQGVADVQFVYACRNYGGSASNNSVRPLRRQAVKAGMMGAIVPDVLGAGDVVMFERGKGAGDRSSVKALRRMPVQYAPE